MATGMVSSSTLSKPAAIRVGETLTTSAAALGDKNSRTFHHMIPGARFIMPDGLEIVFLGGQITTNDPDVIRELGAVADKSTSLIYTRKEVAEAVTANAAKAAADAADTAGKSNI